MKMLTAARGTSSSTADPHNSRLVISTVCLSGTLEDKLEAAAGAGFHGVEILENDLVIASLSPQEIGRAAADLGLSIDVYQPLHVEAVPPAQFGIVRRRAERKFDMLEQLGAAVMLACSSTSPQGVDDDDLAAEQLHALAESAGQRGLRIAYEAVPWGRVASHDHAWRLVQQADHRALGLCLDSFHTLSRVDDPAHIRLIPGSKVFHVQLADAPTQSWDVRDWSLHHRVFPGQGSLDLTGFVSHVLATGYSGPLALEVFNDVYQQADPKHAAIDAMRSILALTEAVRAFGTAPVRSPLPISVPSSAPRLKGFAFTELAVDDISGARVAHALAGLGFTHTGQHRSKPVQLWQQGGARILLNFAPQRAVGPGTAAICALAVDSADPAGSAQRAEQFLAPTLPRSRGHDEAELNSVAAPDGTAVFFCRNDGGDSWLNDFVPTGASPNEPHVLSDIDHVSLTETIDDFDQTALFYRSVLGLRTGESTELTAPFGLIRTLSATDPGDHVRITLSTAPLRHGDWAPAVSKPQHVAFTTDDAVACAKALRANGAPLLTIPTNYYDDLEARFDLPSELLTALRQNSILYDRDEHGEYLHFFTEIVGSQVFFEVVQRIDRYARYGAPASTPLRMAAHRRHRLLALKEPSPAAQETRHDYSLAHLTALSLSPPDLVDAAAAGGYRYVGLRLIKVTPEEPHYPLASDPALMRATKTHLAATGVEVLDVELARISAKENPREYLRFLEAGADLGARYVITQLPDPDFARKTARFAELCELARPLGLSLELEFPSWTETGTLAEAARVLHAADQPNAGILVDTLHFARSDSSLAELHDLPASWFHFAHVGDAPAKIPGTTAEIIHTARFERLFPGDGGIDVRGILNAMPAQIPYALEIPRAMLVAQVGGKEHARMALNAARRHLDGRGKF
jgi:4-hydroxyphenylpyruvate dioxygenase-like putative hemolysin/sugar phosphate isomerase/epimerase